MLKFAGKPWKICARNENFQDQDDLIEDNGEDLFERKRRMHEVFGHSVSIYAQKAQASAVRYIIELKFYSILKWREIFTGTCDL